jgi:hypothetical protein
MEIRFCERCQESIPDGDFDTGRAVRVGGRSVHTACAVGRALTLTGPRAWIGFLLALFGAGAGAYLLIRGNDAPPPPEGVPPVVEARIVEVAAQARDAAGEDAKEALKQEREQDRKWEDGAVSQLRQEILEARQVIEARIAEGERQAGEALGDLKTRLARLEQGLEVVNAWMRSVAERAEREAAASRTPEVPEPAPPTGTDPTGPGPAVEPTPAEPTPVVDPKHEEKLKRWIEVLGDPNEGKAFSATLELSRLKDLRAVPPLVRTLQTHKDYYVRLGAATALGELKAVDAVPALIEALEDRDDLVRTAADESLRAITEQDFGYSAALPANERRRIQGQWKKWWKTGEEELRTKRNQPRQ